MFKRFALLTIVLAGFIANLGCVVPWTAAKQAEDRAAYSLQEALEAPKKFPSVVIVRSTARQFSISIHRGGSTDKQYFKGPVGWLAFEGTFRMDHPHISVQAQFNYSTHEQQDDHEHTIEYWENGKLLLTRYGRGPGVSYASMTL